LARTQQEFGLESLQFAELLCFKGFILYKKNELKEAEATLKESLKKLAKTAPNSR
jgi:hypothetical protein